MSKSISEVFDVEPVSKQFPVAPVVAQESAIEDDQKYAADNIRQLIEIGIAAVREAAEVAAQQESPRAYEVVSTMIKNITDMNGQLLDIHSKRKALLQPDVNNPQQNTGVANVTNNAIFVGTTKDLNEIIMKRMLESGEK